MFKIITLGLSIASVLSLTVEKSAQPEEDDGSEIPLLANDGLKVQITQRGDGPLCPAYSAVEVYYTGKLENGEIFDLRDKFGGEPFKTTIGNGKVI
jgi:FKBP-type peptidyl-prolyl cis-trans isomerase